MNIDKKYYFLITPKLVIFSSNEKSVLLCQRKGENDYDGVYSFAGGKIEITDSSIVAGMKREKDEELGKEFKIKLAKQYSSSVLFQKKDGDMIWVLHFLAIHISGEIDLNKEEYSDHKWVDLSSLEAFEPKIPNINDRVKEMIKIKEFSKEDFIEI